MTDVFADWKSSRFIIADDILSASFDTPHIIVLTDTNYWSTYYEDLISWCRTHGGEVHGMTVNIPSKEVLILFCLSWA